MTLSDDQLTAIKATLADAKNESYVPAATVEVIDAVPKLLAEVEALRANRAQQDAAQDALRAELESARVLVARAEAHERLCKAERVQVRDAQAATRQAGSSAQRVHREAAGLRREVEQLRAELANVRKRNAELGRRYAITAQLHPLSQIGGCSICETCRMPYPCPTLRTLDEPHPEAVPGA